MQTTISEIDARFVIVYNGENNFYDDSDFYYIALDLVERKVIKHVHSTTRFAGFQDLADSVMIESLNQETQNVVRALFEITADQDAEILIAEEGVASFYPGDTLTVSNPRARKYKGSTFELTHTSSYRDMYGRAQTTYAHGVDQNGNEVKTAITNCSRDFIGYANVQRVAERIKLGMSIDFPRK